MREGVVHSVKLEGYADMMAVGRNLKPLKALLKKIIIIKNKRQASKFNKTLKYYN